MIQVRMFLEEIVGDLCQFRHMEQDETHTHAVRITREVEIPGGKGFADILVEPEGRPHYVVEVKYGYPDDQIVDHLALKYGADSGFLQRAEKLILVLDSHGREDFSALLGRVHDVLPDGLPLEVWDEERILELTHHSFGIRIAGLRSEDLLAARAAIDAAKWRYAFKGEFQDHPLQASLLWHLGFWRLRDLHEAKKKPEEILAPGSYEKVVVLRADLCSFSSYVRDTPDPQIAMHALTAFYSKARHQVLAAGGMMYQFIGDEVLAFFGVPDRQEGYLGRAMSCAQRLVEVGESVSHQWQRRIDRLQARQGVHIGMAMGDVRLVAQRPFSQAHVGAIGDAINMAARLTGEAGPREILVSNTVHWKLGAARPAGFAKSEPVEAKNLGRIQAWRFRHEEA